MNVNMSSLAVCDVDVDGSKTSSSARPAMTGLGVGSTGAVYVVWGGWDSGTTVDLAPQNARATIFYGTSTGAHLGTAVACVDLNGDGAGDIIAGAPGAGSRARPDLRRVRAAQLRASRPVDLSSTTTGADIVWTTATAGAELGQVLYAVTPSPGRSPFILAAAPGALVTHLFSDRQAVDDVGAVPADRRRRGRSSDVHRHRCGGAGSRRSRRTGGQRPAAPDRDRRSGVPPSDRYGDAPREDLPVRERRTDRHRADRRRVGQPDDHRQGQELAARHVPADRRHVGQRRRSVRRRARRRQHRRRLRVQARHRPAPAVQLLTTDTDNVVPIAGYEQGGLFGSALASTRAGSANGVGLRLAVGAPNVSLGSNRVAIGAAYLYKADTLRKFRIFEQVYGKDAGDALGTAVAGGQLDDGAIGDLVTAAPNAGAATPATGVVYVRYGQ